MKYVMSSVAAVCGLLLAAAAAQADVRVVSERNEGKGATAYSCRAFLFGILGPDLDLYRLIG